MVRTRSISRRIGVTTLLAGLLSVASAQEARLPELRKAFRPSEDPAAVHAERLESLKIVRGLDSVVVAAALLEADWGLARELTGLDKFRDRLVRTGTTSGAACESVAALHGLQEELRTAMMALREHESVLHLVNEALTNPKLPFTLRIALAEKAPEVPDESLRLCGEALENKRDPGGQLAALAAIRRLGLEAQSLGDQTIACLQSRDAVIREAAAAALVALETPASLGPLMTRLEKERGRTQQRIAGALEILTRESFGTSLDAWREWSKGQGRVMFDGDDILGGGTISEPPRSDGSFFGIPLTGRAILFVVDCSVSTLMEHPEGETRLGRIVTELSRALGQLRRDQRFNIIPFENYAGTSFARDFVTKAHVAKARKWLEKRFRKRFSHDPTIIWKRYPLTRYDATELAFKLAGLPAKDQYYQPRAHTIFYVSDGLSQLWYGRELSQGTPEATLRAMRRWNVNRHVVIHAIQVGGWDDGFLRDVAKANGGRFVVDGK